MVLSGSLQLSHQLGLCKDPAYNIKFKSGTRRGNVCPFYTTLSSRVSFHRQDSRSIYLLGSTYRPRHTLPCRDSVFKCHCFLGPGQPLLLPKLKVASQALVRSYNALQGSPFVLKLIPAVGLIIFSVWGLAPVMRLSRNITLRKSDSSWKKSNTHYIMSSYLQPLLLWTGAILICRALDPIDLPTVASQVVKQRLLNFVRSLSTVLAFAYCLSSLIQQAQKFVMETNESSDTRNMGFQFAGKAIYSAVWVAAVSLFMELLGFSTQRWLTAGGLGTVLLTLAGREIFTNFLSSAMIHATRPFVVNEWIQTKIEGYEVSGTVEHVGWWSPTIIRGEDREAVHIPNHKFTVNVVRNLTQKTHWRIKTHLAISHLDAHKINNIVADMRKVLAKNPQVEQQRLHRRVFFDNINPENQALLILVSCFVKTSHHEEYLCVKEAILLDLLRVISHHRARLATPIRTVQKTFSDADLENVPFADSIYNQGVTSKRPFLLIEPPYKINGEDKTKGRSLRTNGERDGKTTIRPASDNKTDTKDGTISVSDSKIKETQSDMQFDVKKGETSNPQNMDSKAALSSVSDPKTSEVMVKETLQSDSKMNNKATEVSDAGSNYQQTSSASDSSNQKTDSMQSKKSTLAGNGSQSSFNSPPHISSEIGAEKADEFSTSSQVKQGERTPAPQASTSRPVLEDNIVLGVALEGSKRTLPIEEEMAASSHADETELASRQNGQGFQSADRNKKNVKNPASPSSTSIDP